MHFGVLKIKQMKINVLFLLFSIERKKELLLHIVRKERISGVRSKVRVLKIYIIFEELENSGIVEFKEILD